MQRLQIAYAMINTNRRDGSARALCEVAERLSQRHEVHLFARTVADLDLSHIRWHRMPGPGWPAVADFLSYHLLADFKIRAGDFDIIHSIGNNAMASNVITIQNIQPAKRPFLTVAGTQASLARRLTRWLFLNVTSAVEGRVYSNRARHNRPIPLFLPVSQGVDRELRTHYAIGSAPVRIIPNAADTDVFKPLAPEEKARWRHANGLREKDTVLAFAGGEWARKGLEFAIEALARIPRPEVKLLVLGQDAEASRFNELARRLGVGDRIVFGGFRRDVAEGLGASDVFLFPSRYEAFSLATIEAAACGLPIVATRINGAEDFITAGHNGFFIEHNPEQIARTLLPLLTSPELRQEMGRAARRRVEEHYTWDRVADLTETAYFEYLGLTTGKGAEQLETLAFHG
ncbi:MAG: glycosyltransferase family 4 protein [Verrucomicrobia bacterium]|nr:glycosyltransferase family 4 protein [Verrucomicrobiota bacterium]